MKLPALFRYALPAKSTTRFLLSLAGSSLLVGAFDPSVTAAQAGPASTVASEVSIQPGDVLEIRVWRKPELSGDFVVGPDGRIGDPFYSDVNVGAMTLDMARRRIRDHVAQIEVDPLVWVTAVMRVVVVGEVRQPNLYPIRYPTTIAQALALAGGPTDLARLDRIQFVRGGTRQLVDLRNPASAVARTPLLSGDEIIVPRRSTAFRDSLVPISTLASIAALIVTIANQ